MRIRQFEWADYAGVTAVWSAAGREVVPRSELEAKLIRDPELFLVTESALCSKPMRARTAAA